MAKSLKIITNGLKIEVKKEDYTTIDTKSIIFFLQIFYIYIQILIFLASLGNKLQLQLVLSKYAEHLIIL